MGMITFFAIHHDGLPQMTEDPNFGRKVAEAAMEHMNGKRPATVAGTGGTAYAVAQFPSSFSRVLVFHNGVAWVAGHGPTPEWLNAEDVQAQIKKLPR